jgi:LuxR family maltose regulon positive regulatory protein
MTVADAPFDLVEAKLAAPRTRPGSVPKTGVITRLRASQQPFATVIAPAGYGKTTLLARWAEMDPRPFAWVALDGQDDDGIVFLRYIAAAIHRVEPVAPAVFDALGGPGASIWSMAVPRVGSALATLQRPLVLVLDDLHAVRNRSCLDVLAALHEYVPPGSQIAVASREEPALPLARWRTRGWLHEVGVADLRLDEREAGVLLHGAGVELDPAGVADLTGRTEGWPAGLYLAALSLQAGSPGPARAEVFTGEDRFVSEYFRYELLSRLPEAEARFLLHTSVLDSMCGGLCDAVVQTTRSASTLASLEHSNGFVVPLDRRGEWYRYHHLFGQLLRNELERTDPAVAAVLYRRAMAWCMANDLAEAAVRYGHAADERYTVAGLIALQAEYAAWYDVLPDNLRDTATGNALQAIVDLAETFLAGGAGRRTDRLDPQIELAEGGDVADAPIDDEARPAAVSCQAGHDLTDEGHAQGATSVDHENTAPARPGQPPPHQDVVLATVDGADRPFESRSTSELPEHDRADRGSVAVFVEDVRCGGHGVGR